MLPWCSASTFLLIRNYLWNLWKSGSTLHELGWDLLMNKLAVRWNLIPSSGPIIKQNQLEISQKHSAEIILLGHITDTKY